MGGGYWPHFYFSLCACGKTMKIFSVTCSLVCCSERTILAVHEHFNLKVNILYTRLRRGRQYSRSRRGQQYSRSRRGQKYASQQFWWSQSSNFHKGKKSLNSFSSNLRLVCENITCLKLNAKKSFYLQWDP